MADDNIKRIAGILLKWPDELVIPKRKMIIMQYMDANRDWINAKNNIRSLVFELYIKHLLSPPHYATMIFLSTHFQLLVNERKCSAVPKTMTFDVFPFKDETQHFNAEYISLIIERAYALKDALYFINNRVCDVMHGEGRVSWFNPFFDRDISIYWTKKRSYTICEFESIKKSCEAAAKIFTLKEYRTREISV